MPPKIFLLGLPGSGKTTFGKLLASRLSRRFFDLDAEIEKATKLTIAMLFKEHEDDFRAIESEVLTSVIEKEKAFVLSCGGGTPCFHDNMKVMNESGLTIYLQVPVHIIGDRIRKETHRPLMQGREPEPMLRELLNNRSEYYNQAKIRLSPDWQKPEEVEDLLKEAFAKPGSPFTG